ncbi:type I-E CRISPR-associated protein Cas6/Cse3/CasE [Thalassospira sp.]|uniref:type I-E CRISPR-associated protein Cas6/Cse3/CasE n=1 Tax=Thalassospira sp. TaxID=1912094 RepID=UPI00273494A7|nr:type I-E CRISPR-associated protein Cas6/Cse3/CasE [Thalassospira sp.]MDP2699919.1 type I-E CRISPR-associated protein Cas6/Cse3/CasE [Thalassospira sp.]
MTLFMSRVSISRKPSIQALNALLLPDDAGDRTDAHHRLLWTLFADDPDRRRDFLWREERAGEFLVLSVREPMACDLFSRVDVKPYDPVLKAGDRLFFALRANATRTKKGGGRVDVVMDALFALPKDKRAAQRMDIAQSEGASWLERQGDRNGFRVLKCEVTDYSVRALTTHRGSRKGQPQFGILDLQGALEVTEPEAFRQILQIGLGRAKAFGCGLMLVRRAV